LLQGSDATALDAAGNQFITDTTTNAITVVPSHPQTHVGQTIPHGKVG